MGIHGEINKYNLPLAATLVGLNTIAAQVGHDSCMQCCVVEPINGDTFKKCPESGVK